MKKELVQIIKEYIKLEVKAQVREATTKILREIKKYEKAKQLNEQTEPVDEMTRGLEWLQKSKKQATPQKKYTNNTVLNEIFNSTQVESDFGAEISFTTQMLPPVERLGSNETNMFNVNQAPAPNLNAVDTNAPVESAAISADEVETRDYTKFMAAYLKGK